jgi:hypothetical protein
MEARVEQFHSDAARPRDARTPRDIDRLRKFLYKNQEYRFTDREQSHLFQAVQLYVTAYTPSSTSTSGRTAPGPEETNPAAELLEDALKMPFTVFTTAHKKTMLKWLDKLHPAAGSAASTAPALAAGQGCVWYSVIDCSDSGLEVMDEEGNTLALPASSCSAEQWQQVGAAWDAGEEVRVQLSAAGSDGSRNMAAIRT